MRARAIAAIVTLLGAQACTAAVSDLSSFETDPLICVPGEDQQMRDLRLRLIELGVHSTNLFEATVVRRSTGFLTSRLIIDPLENGTQEIIVPNAIPPVAEPDDTFFLDFYADLNDSRSYDSPPTDHTWRRDLACDGSLEFTHIAEFEDLERGRPIGGDVTFHLQNIDTSFENLTLEVHVRARFSGGVPQTVGVYRLGRIGGSDVTLTIPGVVDGGTEHEVLYFVDLDRNRIADSTGGDLICSHTQVGTAAGLAVELDLANERTAGNCMLDAFPVLPRR